MSLRKLAAAIAAIAGGGASAFFVQRAVFSGSDDAGTELQRFGDVALDGVSTKQLADLGLSPPARNYVPRISASQAKNAAGHSEKRVPVKQILLAHLEAYSLGPIDTEVWIISYDPNDHNRVGMCPGDKGIYYLSFVDANSGKGLFSRTEDIPGPGCHGPILPPANTPSATPATPTAVP